MTRTLTPALLIVSGAILSACASSGYMTPTVQPVKLPPLECQTPCDPAPPMDLTREVWELEILRWGFECRLLHQGCVEAIE
jgi:hypothetical protein